MHELGGCATRAQLEHLDCRSELRRAVAAGLVIRVSRGRYVLPQLDTARTLAHQHQAAVSHTSAAALWGWEVRVPDRPHLTVPRHRKVPADLRSAAEVHYGDLDPQERLEAVTSRTRTVLDCLTMPLPDALSAADSALRIGAFTQDNLTALARSRKGAGAAAVRRAAREASGLSANPFESTLRALSLQVPGLDLRPQRDIWGTRWLGRADLVNEHLRVIVEAESHSFHSRRGDLRRDCRRYTSFVLAGWLVARFAWEDVMFEPDLVLGQLTSLHARAVELAELETGRAA